MKRKADLSPPLGVPGGPCHVVNRIEDAVTNPQVQKVLTQEVQEGQDLSNQQASKIYKVEREVGIGAVRELEITSHGQYRMDLRRITVNDVRSALDSFLDHLERLSLTNKKGFENTLRVLDSQEKITWVNPRSKLVIVFKKSGENKATLVTTYWKGMADPPAPGSCNIPKNKKTLARIAAALIKLAK